MSIFIPISLFFFLNILYILSPPAFANAHLVSSIQLIEEAKDYDGKEIVYQGEAIGDVMKRLGQQYAWVNVSDGDSAIGIWSPWSLVKKVTALGSYKYKGDILEITGQFNRVCLEHGGELDIHAQINPQKVKLVILLGILALVTEIINICKSKLGIKRG